MDRVVVLGAGVAGLAAARVLQEKGVEPLVLEREQEVGGACRTSTLGGFHFDRAGHLLHVADRSVREMLNRWDVLEGMVEHQRDSAVFIKRTLVPYPIQLHLDLLPGDLGKRAKDSLLTAQKVLAGSDPPVGSMARWCYSVFGKELTELFFRPYNEKLFLSRLEDLTAEWVGRYVPLPTDERGSRAGYNAFFHYPEVGGIEAVPKRLADSLEISLGSEVVGIEPNGRLLMMKNGEIIPYSAMIATMPLPRLAGIVGGQISSELRWLASRLKWCAVAVVAFGVEGEPPVKHHWVYFPEPEFPFFRVCFPSNWGKVAPEGFHQVMAEVSVPPGGRAGKGLVTAVRNSLADLGWLDPHKVAVTFTTVLDPGYVVFDAERSAAAGRIKRILANAGIVVAGRWGSWGYGSMADAIKEGASAAVKVLGGDGDEGTPRDHQA